MTLHILFFNFWICIQSQKRKECIIANKLFSLAITVLQTLAWCCLCCCKLMCLFINHTKNWNVDE